MNKKIHVKIYTTHYCGYCQMAKKLLREKGIAFEEIDVTGDPAKRDWLVQVTGLKTVPQIFMDDKPLGGYEELVQFFRDQ